MIMFSIIAIVLMFFCIELLTYYYYCSHIKNLSIRLSDLNHEYKTLEEALDNSSRGYDTVIIRAMLTINYNIKITKQQINKTEDNKRKNLWNKILTR